MAVDNDVTPTTKTNRSKTWWQGPDSVLEKQDFGLRMLVVLLRGLAMLFFAVLFEVLNWLVFGIAFVQFLSLALTGRSLPFRWVKRFNEQLSVYYADLTAYLTCARERPLFPFGGWRGGRHRLD